MPTQTANYDLNLPLVNDPTDMDLWGTYLNDNFTIIDTTMKANADAIAAINMSAAWPIGSIYINASVATNPATLLGFGTWIAYGEGQIFMGAGTGTDGNGDSLIAVAGTAVGEYNHILTSSEIPAHTHTVAALGAASNATYNTIGNSSGASSNDATGNNSTNPLTSGSYGSGVKHNNTPYSIPVYAWKRTD